MYRNLASSTTTGLRRITDESVSFHALQMAMLALNFIVLALYDASTVRLLFVVSLFINQ